MSVDDLEDCWNDIRPHWDQTPDEKRPKTVWMALSGSGVPTERVEVEVPPLKGGGLRFKFRYPVEVRCEVEGVELYLTRTGGERLHLIKLGRTIRLGPGDSLDIEANLTLEKPTLDLIQAFFIGSP